MAFLNFKNSREPPAHGLLEFVTPFYETARMVEENGTTENGPAAGSPPIIEPGHSFASVTDKISYLVLSRPASRRWYLGFFLSFALVMLLNLAIGYLLIQGVGI